MKKTSKRYVITTSALNCYLFRILTEGVSIEQYEHNPLMIWMHQRPRGLSKDEVLPVGRFTDLRREGDQITGQPEFDETDPFAMQLFNKYENGTLNMFSPGIIPLEWSEDPDLMLPGQCGPTVTKGKLFEISAVDIGGNDDALPCQLYGADDNIIKLSDLAPGGIITLFNSLQITKKEDTQNMKLINLSAPVAAQILLALKLQDTATEVEVQAKVQELVQLAASQDAKLITQAADLENAKTKATAAETKLAEQIKLAAATEIETLVQGAVDSGKILLGAKPKWIKLAQSDLETAKQTLDDMPGSTTLEQTLNQQKGEAWYTKLSYSQMDKQKGALVKLKAENIEVFKAKYKEHFGAEYKG